MRRIVRIRREQTRARRWPLPLFVGLLLMTGCEMAGGTPDGTLADIPGTYVASEAPTVEEPAGQPQPIVAPGVEVSESTALAIRDAAVEYVRGETAIRDIRVEIDAVADGWARVRTVPAREETDPATMYLRQEGSAWRGVSLGTAFLPEELEEMGVPPAVRR